MFPDNFPFLAVGAQGLLALLMGLKMSQLRVSQMLAKQRVGEGHTFKKWHTAQLNSSEYHPIFMVLYLAVHYAASTANSPLRAGSHFGIALGLAGSLLYILGVSTQADLRGTSFARIIGATLRYLAMGLLAYEVTQY